METFILKLAVAVIPLVVLVASVTIFSTLSKKHANHPLTWQRTRRNMMRALAAGVMLR
jgi:hypothetical protein